MLNFSYFPNLGCIAKPSLCNFDQHLNVAGMLVVFSILCAVGLTFLFLKKQSKTPLKDLLILGLGVLLFESFTAPMWNSFHLGSLTYVYNDMSLVLTLGWVAIFQLSILLVNSVFPKKSTIIQFLLYLVPITILTVVAENLLVLLGIRSYAPEVLETSVAKLGVVPLEILYYAPTFAILVLSFYFAWTKKVGESLKDAFKKNIGLSASLLAIAITLYELLIEPVVMTPGFPAWSYFYQDISIVRIGLWVVMIFFGMWLGSLLISKNNKISSSNVFWLYLLSSSIVFYVVEVMLLANKGRIYTASVITNFTGLRLPLLGTPIEVVIAIVIYLALIISFLKYWRYVFLKK